MLKTLKIENFRCFQEFELQQLGRLNLLVGTNNSGKTSILEAIQLLTSPYNLEILKDIMMSRGEYLLTDKLKLNFGNRYEKYELDIRHLFYGHEINIGSRFSILGKNNNHEEEKILVSVEKTGQLSLFEDLQELVLMINSVARNNEQLGFPLSSQEGMILDYLRGFPKDIKNLGVKTQFVTSSSLTTEKMIKLFDQVVLNPEEDLVIKALQIIEPNIKRIANLSSDQYRKYPRYNDNSRSGFVVLFEDNNQRIPIGSLGDGIWRILGLTLALVNARNGILLVDEIDTGLHFTTMSDMWKLVWETAKELNVQVFATTHNSDCWTSLATIANAENPSEEGITIHRIEKGKNHSIVFTEPEIVIAAEEDIEVR